MATRVGSALVAAVVAALLAAGCSSAPHEDGTSTATVPAVSTGAASGAASGCPAADGSAPKQDRFDAAPPMCIDPAKRYAAHVTTNHGEFTITLDAAATPITANNFVVLARSHYYDGTDCHRVIPGFVVQCGRPAGDESAPGYTIADELPEAGEYAEGVVAMANTGAPDTGGGQWFVITGPDGASLSPSYSIVGRVTEGYETTVKALEALADPAAPNGVGTLEPIEITSVRIEER